MTTNEYPTADGKYYVNGGEYTIEDNRNLEWMVLRLRNGELFDITVKGWESYLLTRAGETTAKEVCRGLTKADAENLTMLGNKQRSMEK